MMGFILSKMDLLILVTAITAIIGFFTFGLVEVTKVSESNKLVSKLKENTFSLVNSPAYCFSDREELPGQITVSGNSFYYVLRISQSSIDIGDDEVNVLIYSLYPREEIRKQKVFDADYTPKAVAANSFRTDADIYLWSLDYEEAGGALVYTGQPLDKSDDGILIDPQAEVPANSIEFIKEIKNGQPRIHIIGCNSAVCESNKQQVEDSFYPAGEGFGC